MKSYELTATEKGWKLSLKEYNKTVCVSQFRRDDYLFALDMAEQWLSIGDHHKINKPDLPTKTNN